MKLRAHRRDRAARRGVELFLFQRAFEDCLERIALHSRRFDRALLVGCPDPAWPERITTIAASVDVRDPGPIFARAAQGACILEDAWYPPEAVYDLAIIGTLDTVNDVRLALRLIRHAMNSNGLFIGALSGGDTLPRLRSAMRAADELSGTASPHVHPRIDASALSPLLVEAGFVDPVVDIDRVTVSYPSLQRLVDDLRGMAATNVLTARPRFISRDALSAAADLFATPGNEGRIAEIFEILHFAAWTRDEG